MWTALVVRSPTFADGSGRRGRRMTNSLPLPGRVAGDGQPVRREGHRQPVLLGGDEGPAPLDRLADAVAQVDRLDSQVDPPTGDPGHVEQVVDQPGELPALAADDVPGPGVI